MITFEEAYNIVLKNKGDFGLEEVELKNAFGKILKEDCHTDRNLPPYDRITMDGIAINFDNAASHKKLKLESIALAGSAQTKLNDPSNAIEVMTGSILPLNTDTVIRYEDLTIEDKSVVINVPFKKSQNIHFEGEDRQKGELVLNKNTRLNASHIGVCASIGKSKISVSKSPKTLIISTGDELVEVDETPLKHQIRRSNVYRIAATLLSKGIIADTAHLLDEYDSIVKKLSEYVNNYDLIILSGGVSKGKFDFLPKAFEELGVSKHFHKVKQRPGKPFWFGTYTGPNKSKCTIFALPGNPVSSFMCTQVYLMDWLDESLGLKLHTKPRAILQSDVNFKPDLTYFLEVKTSYSDKGEILATPQKGNGSGDLANLTNAQAFLKLPQGKSEFKKGEVFELYWY